MEKNGITNGVSTTWGDSRQSSLESNNSDGSNQNHSHQGCNSHMLHVHILKGCDLAARDKSGSSDPYVTLKLKDKLLFKTRKIFQNLNPIWDEHYEYPINDLSMELLFEVYDYDRIGKDDYMGSAAITLQDLKENEINKLKLVLKDNNLEKYMGFVLANVSLTPMTSEEEAQLRAKKGVLSKLSKQDSLKSESTLSLSRFRKGTHTADFLVNIILAEGRNLIVPGMHRSHKTPPDPYVKLKIGPTKFKSKAASKTYAPNWVEQFNLRSYCMPDQPMEMDVCDKRRDDLIGRCKVDLSKLPKNVTNQCWCTLENGAGEILLLITISSINTSPHDEQSFNTRTSEEIAAVTEKYKPIKTFENMSDVGFLVVKVYKAQGLASADLGTGKSDPFCVLELVNDRVQTSTIQKSLSPEWNQYFTFSVKDIHSILEVTVYDEDQKSDPEFLGKVGIPLLKIRDGDKRWYSLKDRQLQRRAKGQILLEMKLMWNPVRAAARTFKPKEQKYLAHASHFQRQTLIANLNRVKRYIAPVRGGWSYVQSCFAWESPARSLIAFIIFLLVTYNWHVYMIPMAILAIFGWSYLGKIGMFGQKEQLSQDEEYIHSSEESDDDSNVSSSESLSLAERFRGLQDKLLEVQNILDFIASTFERIRNVFTFSQPFLSCLAIIIFTVATILLYFIPARYLIMAWGINKFTKRLRKKKSHTPNNEVMDYLSRVFSDKEVRMYGEFHVLQPMNTSN